MVAHELIPILRASFKEYIIISKSRLYDLDSNIEKTILHIERVVGNILVLADDIQLNEDEKAVAEIAALFHDIGRIWLLLPENSDAVITDHAEASIEYLKTNEAFHYLDDMTQNIIIRVINNHNKPDLPIKEGEHILFYSKLLRDADKLDSWRSTSDYVSNKSSRPNMATELYLSEKPVVTPSLTKIIIDCGIPDKSEVVTFNDFTIFQMSWIFDLHFKKSFQIVNQKQYFRHM